MNKAEATIISASMEKAQKQPPLKKMNQMT